MNTGNEKESQIFRQKSLDRISSPEELNDYIRVASPGIWLILTGIVVLLAGIIVWSVCGSLDTKIDAVCVTDNERTVCYISEDYIGRIQKGMAVTLSDGTECRVTGFAREACLAEDTLSEYQLYVSGIPAESWLHALKLDRTFLDGVQMGKITIDTIRPIDFIIS